MTATEHLHIEGLGLAITWDGRTLRAKGTSRSARFALMGDKKLGSDEYIRREDGRVENIKGLANYTKDIFDTSQELVLDRDDFTVKKYKKWNAISRGQLHLVDSEGHSHQMYFRRKDNEGLELLADALGVS